MVEKDETSRATLGDLRTALALLTRLPIKAEFDHAERASWAYPIAGLAVGLIAALVVTAALWLGLIPAVAAALWIITSLLITGALHEDGLADCADGFWGGWEKDRRLEIMKDSQIGSYGVLALILGIGLRWVMVTTLMGTGTWVLTLLSIEILSRSVMPAVMHALPHSRSDGLSHAQGRPPLSSAALAFAWASIAALFMIGWAGLGFAILAAGAAICVALLAQRKIGGQTGDVLGASQQVALIAMLLFAA